MAQYWGKPSQFCMVKVPPTVAKEASFAFELQNLGFQGATETGWKRAEQLSTQSEIPLEDLRFMRNWYARHVYTSYPGYKKWTDAGSPKTKEWFGKRSILSWLTWGGNSALDWVNSDESLKLLDEHFKQNYAKIEVRKEK